MRSFLGAAVLAAIVTTPAAAQDVAAGQRVFNQCRACHQVGETARNAVGPKLNGLFGRKVGTVEGFRYSAANQAVGTGGQVWDEAYFTTYIQNPREVMRGTTMAFAGIKNDQQIKDLIAYLKQFDADGKIKTN